MTSLNELDDQINGSSYDQLVGLVKSIVYDELEKTRMIGMTGRGGPRFHSDDTSGYGSSYATMGRGKESKVIQNKRVGHANPKRYISSIQSDSDDLERTVAVSQANPRERFGRRKS